MKLKHRMTPGLTILLVVAAILNTLTFASGPENYGTDSLKEDLRDPVRLDDVVVKANRLPFTLMEIPAAASVKHTGSPEKSRFVSAGDLIGSLPGFRAYPIGNVWGKSQVDVRGFYGGTQAEYLMVNYDGLPMNNMASGQVPWGIINFNNIDRMESISGPVSAQYGDFGMGGLIALYSPTSADKYSFELNSSAGSNNAWELYAGMGTRMPSISGNVSLSKRKSDGWREHSRFEAENVHITLDKGVGERSQLSGIFAFGHSEEKYPGALTEEELVRDRTSATSLNGLEYPDYAQIDDFRGGISSSIELANEIELKSQINISSTKTEEVVSILLPVRHGSWITSTEGEISLGLHRNLWDRGFRVIIGFRGEYGAMDSDYSTFEEIMPPDRIRKGEAYRRVLAGYVHGMYHIHKDITISAGLRFDNIWSRYHCASDADSQEETAISPKFALSMNLGQNFNLYGSVAAAFKAPTLVHLYDSPPIYFEFPPGTWSYHNVSNADLEAQTGSCYETGVKYHDSTRTSGRLSLYDYEISNEIDFDLSTQQYMNIGRSRHLGLELEASRYLFSHLTASISLAYTASIIRAGEFYGNQINGVPFIEYDWQIMYKNPEYGYLAVNNNGRGRQYMDQTNLHMLGEYNIWGISAGISLRNIDLNIAVRNIFDREYNLDGFMGLMNENRFYPAPGRTIKASLSRRI